MLPNHSSLVIAEQFGTLESFFPEELILVWEELRNGWFNGSGFGKKSCND
jgi:hypothetical protein